MSRVFHTVLLVWGGRTQLSARSAEFRREAATFVDNLCVFCLVIMAFFEAAEYKNYKKYNKVGIFQQGYRKIT